MSVITGDNYRYIDLKNNDGTVRHMLEDETARQDIETLKNEVNTKAEIDNLSAVAVELDLTRNRLDKKIDRTTSDAELAAAALDSKLTALSGQRLEIVSRANIEQEWRERLKDHATRYFNTGYGFLFFTDPHNVSKVPFSASQYSLIEDLRYIQAIWENTPAKTVLCGGDWLTQYHTREEVIYLSGRIQRMLKTEIGPEAWTVLGNHDIGEVSGVKLTSTQVARMWFGRNQTYYILDAAEDLDIYMLEMGYSISAVSSRQWDELAWIADKLLHNTKPHLFGVGHICLGGDGAFFGKEVCALLQAFNKKTSITANGVTYDFSGATGTFHFIMAGHYHYDYLYSDSGMPVIAVDDFATTKAVDLAFADWNNAKLYLDRVGAGASRVINIIPTGGFEPAE